MFFFNTGLGYVPEIMTTGNVFKRRGVVISNNNDRGLLIFFIHGSDIAKPEWIIWDLNLAQYFSNFKNRCFSRLRLNRFENLFDFFLLQQSLPKLVYQDKCWETNKTEQPLLSSLYQFLDSKQVYSTTHQSSQILRYTVEWSGQGIC